MSFSSSGGKFESALLHVRDEKSSGSHGGTSTSGSFQTRVLNTSMTNEISGASLASNQITLPAGTYFIMAQQPIRGGDDIRVLLRNITDSSNTIVGTSEYVTGNASAIKGFIIGRFTIASSKVFEIQYRVFTGLANTGLGLGSNYSVVEVYTDVQIWKVA